MPTIIVQNGQSFGNFGSFDHRNSGKPYKNLLEISPK